MKFLVAVISWHTYIKTRPFELRARHYFQPAVNSRTAKNRTWASHLAAAFSHECYKQGDNRAPWTEAYSRIRPVSYRLLSPRHPEVFQLWRQKERDAVPVCSGPFAVTVALSQPNVYRYQSSVKMAHGLGYASLICLEVKCPTCLSARSTGSQWTWSTQISVRSCRLFIGV